MLRAEAHDGRQMTTQSYSSQKVTFHRMKGDGLPCKRSPFIRQRVTLCKTDAHCDKVKMQILLFHTMTSRTFGDVTETEGQTAVFIIIGTKDRFS